MVTRFFFLCVIVLSIIGCSDEKSHVPKQGNSAVSVSNGQSGAMNDSINRILKSSMPVQSIYENEVRMNFLKDKIKQEPQNEKLMFNYARELLNNGNSQLAITQIESILNNKPSLKTINELSKKFHEFLAVCHLRIGEQKNCQENHNDASCIIPFADNAIHKYVNGSEKAIDIYMKILKVFPEDYQSRWLLNVGFMTLGKYPADVPSKFLIPISDKKKNIAMSMENISTKLGIDGFGLSGGVIADDFNNDGYIDIVSSTWGTKGQMFYFQNDGKGSFVDKTKNVGLDLIKGGLNLIQTDFNNDGNLDIYILRGGWMPEREWGIMPNSLLKNNGDGLFTDVTIEVGLYNVSPSQSASWFDYDNDGDLDLFIANESNSRKEKFPCNLFENNNYKFTDVAPKYGINVSGYFKGVTTADLDNDGFQDIYISNLRGNNLYFQAVSADGKLVSYKENALAAGITKPNSSFPCWTFDVNNDGYEDIYVASYDMTAFRDQSGQLALDLLNKKLKTELNCFYLNNGDGTFDLASDSYFTERSLATMGCNYGDINNDGYLDFYLGTGAPDYRAVVPNRMFVNKRGKSFVDKTFEFGMGHIQKGHGISFADFDNDGDQDVYAVMGGAFKGDKFPNAFFLNKSSNENNWLKIKLEGTQSNHVAIGAKLKIHASNGNQETSIFYSTINSGSSFGANTLLAEIGIGMNDTIEKVEINWPNGKNDWISYDGIDVNKKYLIKEGAKPAEIAMDSYQFVLNNSSSHSHHH